MSNIVWRSLWLFTWLFYSAESLTEEAKLGLYDKFMSTRQKLTDTIYENSAGHNSLEIKTSMLWSRELEIERSSFKVPIILKTNNNTIMLHNKDLSVFKDEDLQYRYTLESYFAFDVHFMKGFEWQDKIYILICFRNSICNLYSAAPDFDFIFHQSISDFGDPTDAQFFVQREKLYLVFLFCERAFSHRFSRTNSKLRLYEWQDIIMDKDESIPDISSTATCIALFEYNEDIVMVLGCPEEESLKFPSQVWRRKANGNMALVQYLPTDRPISINHFVERRENFIIILEKDRKSSVYWWKGSEFLQWFSVDGMERYFQVAEISNIKNTALLSFVSSNVLRICRMTSANFNRIYETEFLNNANMIEEILTVKIFEENNIPYMLVLTTSGTLVRMSLYKINIQFLDTIATDVSSTKMYQRDTAQESLDKIYKAVRNLKLKLANLDSLSSSVLLTNKNASIRNAVVIGETHIKSGEIKEIVHRQMDIAIFIDQLYNSTKSIAQGIEFVRQKLQTTHVSEDRHINFVGKVIVKNAKINTLNAQLINGNIFEPQYFLRTINQNQWLKNINVKSIKVDWLVVDQIGDKNVTDVQLAGSRVKVPVTATGLVGRNLILSENATINNITVEELTKKMVTVESEDVSNRISQMGGGKVPRRQDVIKLQDNTVIENLYVDFIDDVPVHHTLASLFVNGISNTIDGDINFQAGVRTKEVAARRFDFSQRQNRQYPPSETNIPQSQMNMPPSQINFLPFPPRQMNIPPRQGNIPPPQIGIPPPDMYIPPPQGNMYSLLLPNIPSQRLYSSNVQQYPQQWIPINPLTLGRRTKRDAGDSERTVRRKKIKIIGNLKVARLLFRNSSLSVSNQSVPTSKLGETFWTSKTPQKINGSVHFTEGITIAGDLESPIINGKNLSCYASRRSNLNSLIFENISVNGNLTTEGNSTVWMPKNQQASNFKVLNVKHIKTNYINGEKISHILQTKDLLQGGMNIFTENLVVDGNLDADLVNNINLSQKLKSAVMTDSNIELNNVEFRTLSGENINVKNVNDPLEYLKSVSSRPYPVVHIQGDINLSQLSNVASINGYSADFSKVVSKKTGAVIYGKKRFPAQFTVTQELNITNINNVNFENYYKNILKVSGDQEVSGLYTIGSAEMKSKFYASSINGIDLSNLLFINEPEVVLPSSVRFNKIEVKGNVKSRSLHGSCQLPKQIEDEIVFEESGMWSKVEIVGDATWPKLQGGRIQHLFDSAVTSHEDQTITGNVTIQHLSVPIVQVQSLNGKNISFIFQDSLSRRKEMQVISGKKTFKKSFKCKSIRVKGNAEVKRINKIKLNNINDKLVRLSGNGTDIVTGHKTFLNGFKAFSLLCPGGINGIKKEDLVSRSLSKEAPHFSVKSLKVHNSLNVDIINNLNLKDFLEDCIYLKSSKKQRILGRLHIKGNVFLHGNVTTPCINKIPIHDIIFVNNRKPVRINGCKIFSSDVKIESDPKVHVLNGRNLTETFRENVKTYQNFTINGSLVITSDVKVNTIYAKEYFVGTKQIHLNRTLSP